MLPSGKKVCELSGHQPCCQRPEILPSEMVETSLAKVAEGVTAGAILYFENPLLSWLKSE